MDTKPDNPYAALEPLFHEPSRLAILSALGRSSDGITFVALKEECGLTDGNLSRHLKALEAAGVVGIEKAFAGARPRTTVILSDKGRESFLAYLAALEAVLKQAAAALAPGAPAPDLPVLPVRWGEART
ncbi:MAG: transcriptional regulator [Planctomycetota bacterium]